MVYHLRGGAVMSLRLFIAAVVTMFMIWTLLGFSWEWWEGVAGGLVIAFVCWLATLAFGVSKGAVNQRAKRNLATRERLTPQAKMTLSEADEIEPRAREEYVAGIHRVNAARDAYVKVLTLWCAEVLTIRNKQQENQAMLKHAASLADFNRTIKKEFPRLAESRQQLTDAWLSRMYWHDQRGTAKDVVHSERLVTDDMLVIVASTTDGYAKSLETLRSAFAGRTPEMQKAYEEFAATTKDLIAETVNFEWFCATVLDFKKRRTGWRGIVHRMTRH